MGRKASEQNIVPPCRRAGGRHGCWCAMRAFEGIGCAHPHAERIQRSCQRAIMAEASEAFSVRECARGKQATKQGASPGVAERARARCAGVVGVSVSFGFSRSVVDKKGLSKKFFRLGAAGYGGAGFQLVRKFL